MSLLFISVSLAVRWARKGEPFGEENLHEAGEKAGNNLRIRGVKNGEIYFSLLETDPGIGRIFKSEFTYRLPILSACRMHFYDMDIWEPQKNTHMEKNTHTYDVVEKLTRPELREK